MKANLEIHFPLKRHGIVYCQGTTVIQFSHVTSANCIFVLRPIKTVLPQLTNFSKEHLIGILKRSVVHQVHLTTVWRRGQIWVQSQTNIGHWTAGVFSPICTTSACIKFPQLPRQFHHIIAPSPSWTNHSEIKSTDSLSYNKGDEDHLNLFMKHSHRTASTFIFMCLKISPLPQTSSAINTIFKITYTLYSSRIVHDFIHGVIQPRGTLLSPLIFISACSLLTTRVTTQPCMGCPARRRWFSGGSQWRLQNGQKLQTISATNADWKK